MDRGDGLSGCGIRQPLKSRMPSPFEGRFAGTEAAVQDSTSWSTAQNGVREAFAIRFSTRTSVMPFSEVLDDVEAHVDRHAALNQRSCRCRRH